jgi:ATP citrate (pro-S)-lyase
MVPRLDVYRPLLQYERDPESKVLVFLSEVDGIEEYHVIDAVKAGVIKKPVVAWAIGMYRQDFTTEARLVHVWGVWRNH